VSKGKKKPGRATSDDDLFSGSDADAFGGTADDLFAEAEPDTDPIGEIDYPGTADGDCAATLKAVKSAFQVRAAEEAKRFEAATDSEYWCALVFETREQKEAFLAAMRWLQHGDKYLDGILLARQQGVALPPAKVPYRAAKPDQKLHNLSLPLDN
jgi:hypothetical protein